MPLTTIDPRTALIVVDMQKGIAAYPMVHPLADVVTAINVLLDAFHHVALPVVLVVAAGGSSGRTDQPSRVHAPLPPEATELLPNLHHAADDCRVTKHARSAFSNTGLAEHLRKQGVTQVVVVGIATSNGVESTARQAFEEGFNVTLPIDAMTDSSPDSHAYSISKVFPRLAETGTTKQVVELLDKTRG